MYVCLYACTLYIYVLCTYLNENVVHFLSGCFRGRKWMHSQKNQVCKYFLHACICFCMCVYIMYIFLHVKGTVKLYFWWRHHQRKHLRHNQWHHRFKLHTSCRCWGITWRGSTRGITITKLQAVAGRAACLKAVIWLKLRQNDVRLVAKTQNWFCMLTMLKHHIFWTLTFKPQKQVNLFFV